jgi:hypothetical protein
MQNFCDWVKKDKYVYEDFLKFTNLPPYNSCPAVPKVILQCVKNPLFFVTNLSRNLIKLTDLDKKVSYLTWFRLSELKIFYRAILSLPEKI